MKDAVMENDSGGATTASLLTSLQNINNPPMWGRARTD